MIQPEHLLLDRYRIDVVGLVVDWQHLQLVPVVMVVVDLDYSLPM
jgi:hypothetical protein